MADIEDLGGLALDHGGAENAGLLARDLDVERVLDDVDDLVDHERHAAHAVGEDEQRLRAVVLDLDAVVDADQRHQLAAILQQVAAVRELDLLGLDLLEPRDERERHRLGIGGAGAEDQQRRLVLDLWPRLAAVGMLHAAAAPIAVEPPTASATPFGSRIMITEPSPRMVLPEKAEMWRSLVAIGFTTISSVWNTPSTTMPNMRLPIWVTTMKPVSTVLRVLAVETEQAAEMDQRQELVAQAQHRACP